MELMEAIMRRRSYRAFTDEPVALEDVEKIVEAGLWAPSGMASQSAIVVEIADEEAKAQIEAANARVAGMDGMHPFYNAPVVLVVLGRRDVPTHVYDAACAAENMLLAATGLGLGSIWVHRAREVFDTPEGKELLARAGVEGDYEGVANVCIGHPASPDAEGDPRKEGRVFTLR